MAIIGLDAISLSQYGKGVSRYQYNLIKGLSKIDQKNRYYVFLNRRNILPQLPVQDNFRYVRVYIPKRIIWDQFQLPMLIKRYRLNLYHGLTETLPVLGKIKFVLSVIEIPDYRINLMRHSIYDSLYARLSHAYNKFLFNPSLEKADVIIANSHNTKEDLIQRYKTKEDKIRVSYFSADEQFGSANDQEYLFDIRKKYNAQEGYILHISTQDPRENTPAVIRAFEKTIRTLKFNKKLLICGDARPKEAGLDKLIKELNLEDKIIFTGHCIDNELVQLYQAADLFIEFSFYEGFGLQVVEAMSCGIPVIASNVTSLPEVVGGAGILVSPGDISGLSSAINRVLTDSELSSQLRYKSLERAEFFSWDKTAKQTLEIYHEILAK
jgi:glycosyltransferase involved in cell wall biosynthesis